MKISLQDNFKVLTLQPFIQFFHIVIVKCVYRNNVDGSYIFGTIFATSRYLENFCNQSRYDMVHNIM
jgi:hypothetical protein